MLRFTKQIDYGLMAMQYVAEHQADAPVGVKRIADEFGIPAEFRGYEHELLAYGTELLSAISGVRLIGTARHKAAVLSFVLDGVHDHDLGTILDQQGVAVRAGHHCAMPVMQRFGVPATARASMAFYNTRAELETLAAAIEGAREIFG